MGRWAQARKRGRGVQTAPSLPVPVLTDGVGDELSWAVAGVVPVHAEVWLDDGSGFALVSTQAWASTFDASPVPGSYKVRGTDAGNVPVTQFSNIVVII